MSRNIVHNRATALADARALQAGLQKHFPNGSLTFGNATRTTASLVTLLQGVIDALTAVNAAEAATKDALSTLKTVHVPAKPVLRQLRKFLVATFEGSTTALADFGIAPPKERTPSPAKVKAAAADKAKATRAQGGAKAVRKQQQEGNTAPAATPPAPAKPTS